VPKRLISNLAKGAWLLRDFGDVVRSSSTGVYLEQALTLALYIERLNVTLRERLDSLTRRGRTRACHTRTLQHGMSLSGMVSNVCTPQTSLAYAERGTTLAMVAGITDHCWTVHELQSFPVPLPRWIFPRQRGRRSRTLHRLIKRWCPS
jgi:hypothetical protein